MAGQDSGSPITRVLARLGRGEAGAADELLSLVYDELRQLAAARIAKLPPGQTLQATALVHEAWMKLGQTLPQAWADRGHFFAAAARSMRNILVDQARRKARLRRNQGKQPEELTADVATPEGAPSVDILALDAALTQLGEEYERPAQIVSLRYFAGFSIAEIAEILGVSTRTVDREWLFARTWLRRSLGRMES